MKIILMVLDSLGIGAAPDAQQFGDAADVNTLATVLKHLPSNKEPVHLKKLGLTELQKEHPRAGTAFTAKATEASKGKDTVVGHWEIAGLISDKAFPVFPEGFPRQMIDHIKAVSQREVLCNRPASGTEIIQDLGPTHMETGALIVYTSSDSVLQIAAHESIVPLDELYALCERLRHDFTAPDECVNRIIARPFIGPPTGPFTRTANRRDYTVPVPEGHLLTALSAADVPIYAVGKISSIFPNVTFNGTFSGHNNDEAVQSTLQIAQEISHGFVFVNLVDFDMLYGHRRDPEGYAQALLDFDEQLPAILKTLNQEDWLILTADHGCDPGAAGTDHTREKTPVVFYSPQIKHGQYLDECSTFADIAHTIANLFEVTYHGAGRSFASRLTKPN